MDSESVKHIISQISVKISVEWVSGAKCYKTYPFPPVIMGKYERQWDQHSIVTSKVFSGDIVYDLNE